MATQKRAEEIRGIFGEVVAKLEVAGFEVAGRTKEGMAFQSGEEVVIVKTIVKKEDFDLEDAMQEFLEAAVKRVERSQKHAEKVAKAKEKAEKEKAEKAGK